MEASAVDYYCHYCQVNVVPLEPNFLCPNCHDGFVEKISSTSSDPTVQNENDEGNTSRSWESLSGGLGGLRSLFDSNGAFGVSSSRLSGNNRRGLPNTNRNNNAIEHLLADFVTMSQGIDGGNPIGFLVGNPGDYAWGREGLDTVVAQLFNQIDSSGPPPLTSEKIQALPLTDITDEQIATNVQCSVCWDSFNKTEKVRLLPCEHIYHDKCIVPWLQLHGTCPICRKQLSDENERTNNPVPTLEALFRRRRGDSGSRNPSTQTNYGIERRGQESQNWDSGPAPPWVNGGNRWNLNDFEETRTVFELPLSLESMVEDEVDLDLSSDYGAYDYEDYYTISDSSDDDLSYIALHLSPQINTNELDQRGITSAERSNQRGNGIFRRTRGRSAPARGRARDQPSRQPSPFPSAGNNSAFGRNPPRRSECSPLLRNQVRCYNCRRFGHFARECTATVPNLPSLFRPHCTHCDKFGHATEKCWYAPPNLRSGSSTNSRNVAADRNKTRWRATASQEHDQRAANSGNSSPNTSTSPYSSFSSSHRSSNSSTPGPLVSLHSNAHHNGPNRPKRCHLCNKPGHIARNCRNKTSM